MLVDIRQNKTLEHKYAAFVFIKKMLIGTNMSFKNYRIVPISSGLNKKAQVEFINDFLEKQTSLELKFKYQKTTEEQHKNESPVFVVYFPTILSDGEDDVRSYVRDETLYLLQALSLSRDASGEIFNTVILHFENDCANNYSIRDLYKGNLVTSIISGDNSDTLQKYIDSLKYNPIYSFLVHLYKEAQRKHSGDFKYFRYWQILETLAQSQNYNETKTLIDNDGNNITRQDGTIIKLNEPKAIVYTLFQYFEVCRHIDMWKFVNIWLAFRNSVAHFGSIGEYEKLKSKSDRYWAKVGID